MIINITHDVTNVRTGIVAHGCNCQGVMGSGVARAVRQTWPKAYSEYVLLTRQYSAEKTKAGLLGTVQIVQVDEYEQAEPLYVANCFTQEYYGSDGKVYASLGAVQEALGNVIAFSEQKKLPLYLPKIGCGYGGLDWDTQVFPILHELADDANVAIYVCTWK